jgi:transposase
MVIYHAPMSRRPAPPLPMSAEQRSTLEAMARSTALPHRAVIQSKALLWASDGLANDQIARRCQVDSDAIRRWRHRFAQEGTAGVGRIAKGRGRKPSLPHGISAEVMRVTRQVPPPDGGTHWTSRRLAAYLGVGKDTVAQIWRDHEVKPWRVEYFTVSQDPHFEEKLVDVVGLYMDPPEKAAVFCFDEKTQVQALDRTQPGLPMKRGRAGTMTHDYKRNGTVDLFAALNVATGEVLYETRKRHTGEDVLAFFKLIDRQVPTDLTVHVVLDNLSAHLGPDVTRWLDHRARARWHLHFTPYSSSWLNLVERWFNELTARQLRRGAFSSVGDLVAAITAWSDRWNQDPKPFLWHARAEEIIEKVRRGRAALHQLNSQTDH